MNIILSIKSVYILIVIVTLYNYFKIKKTSKNLNLLVYLYYFSFALYFLFVNTEYYADLVSYEEWLVEANNRILVHIDKGFALLMCVISIINHSFIWYKIIILIIIMKIFQELIKKNGMTDKYLFFFLVLSNPRIIDILLNSTRAGIAILLFMTTFNLVGSKKYIFRFFSLTFHIALVGLSIFVLMLTKKIKSNYLLLCMILSICLYIYGLESQQLIDGIKLIASPVITSIKGDAVNNYIFNEDIQGLYNKINYLYYVLSPLVFLFLFKKINTLNECEYELNIIYIFVTLVLVAGPYFPVLFRLMLIPYILTCLLLSRTINRGNNFLIVLIYALINSATTIYKVELIRIV